MRRALALAALLLAGAPAAAQDYPTKPVRLVVPYAAGGTVDILARLRSTWPIVDLVQNPIDHPALRLLGGLLRDTGGQVWHRDGDRTLRAKLELGVAGRAGIEHRFLEHHHATVPGAAGHQVLRALNDEDPAQMR